jgi:hypothetical protein
MKLFFKIIKFVLAGISLIILISFLGFCVYLGGECSYKDSLTQVKSLPKERLEDLFISMEKLKAGANENTLAAFTYIDYKHIDLMSNVIVLGGCFDNKAILKFNGLENQENVNQSIVLSYGENPLKIETLWER